MSFSEDDMDKEIQQKDQKLLNERFGQHWGTKERRRSSGVKKFVGDSQSLDDHPKLKVVLAKNGEHTVMFSDVVVRINRKGRAREHWLMITDGSVYLLEVGSAKVQYRIPLANISHISSSLLPDNFFIIHAPADRDRLFNSGRKTEIVTTIRIAYFDCVKQELDIVLQNIIDYRVDKDQVRRVVFHQGKNGVYTKLFARKSK